MQMLYNRPDAFVPDGQRDLPTIQRHQLRVEAGIALHDRVWKASAAIESTNDACGGVDLPQSVDT